MTQNTSASIPELSLHVAAVKAVFVVAIGSRGNQICRVGIPFFSFANKSYVLPTV